MKAKLKKYGSILWQALKQPMIAIVLGLLVGVFFIVLAGESPVTVYQQMFEKSFFKPYYLIQTLTRATPIIICGLATSVAWRAGYINIGTEGQMITGAMAATLTALYFPVDGILGLIISIALGMAAGALYASIVTFLNMKFQVSIVICTLMMNYIANYVASYCVTYPFKDPSGDGLSLMTMTIPENMQFPILSEGTTLNLGIVIAALVMLLCLFVNRRMVFGYESKMTGLNPNFAKYGGVMERRVMIKTLALSGAIAAIAGICEIFGYKYRYIDNMFTSASYAWTGLMAALIANLHPVGIFFSAIFLSGLQVGGQAIQRTTSIPIQMATVIQSSITLFISVKIGWSFIKLKKKQLKAEAGGSVALDAAAAKAEAAMAKAKAEGENINSKESEAIAANQEEQTQKAGKKADTEGRA